MASNQHLRRVSPGAPAGRGRVGGGPGVVSGALLACGAVGVGVWLTVRALRSFRAISLRGKVALVSGGSRGLGLVLARELAAEGADVVICARDYEALQRAYEDLVGRGARVLAIPCDITDPEQARQAVDVTVERRGRVDVLINNAGTIAVGPYETQTRVDYEQAMAANYWGALNLIQAAVPSMRARGEGRIVNITSIGGKVSIPHLLPYSASKFALVGLSEGLRAELAQYGIVVTTICPGLMRTGSPRNALFKGKNEAEYAWFSASDALPGLAMSAESAARKILAACKRGDAEVTLGLPAKAAVLFHGLFPGLTSDLCALVNSFLPGPGGIGQEAVRGKDSDAGVVPDWLRGRNKQAALENNEVPPAEAAAADQREA